MSNRPLIIANNIIWERIKGEIIDSYKLAILMNLQNKPWENFANGVPSIMSKIVIAHNLEISFINAFMNSRVFPEIETLIVNSNLTGSKIIRWAYFNRLNLVINHRYFEPIKINAELEALSNVKFTKPNTERKFKLYTVENTDYKNYLIKLFNAPNCTEPEYKIIVNLERHD